MPGWSAKRPAARRDAQTPFFASVPLIGFTSKGEFSGSRQPGHRRRSLASAKRRQADTARRRRSSRLGNQPHTKRLRHPGVPDRAIVYVQPGGETGVAPKGFPPAERGKRLHVGQRHVVEGLG